LHLKLALEASMVTQSENQTIADVIIIGGGVIGTSIAYHLARRGMKNVIVLEKESLGSGSTSKAPGGIRQQFGREIEIRFAVESMKFWQNFEEYTGYPLGFRRVGYLFLLTTEDEVQEFRNHIELQHRFGIPSRLLSSSEVLDLVPGLANDGILGAAYCSTDGRISPADATYGYAGAARRLGTRLMENVEVLDICVEKGRVSGVKTSKGAFSAPIVINAAGPWAPRLAALIGIDLPVNSRPLHVITTGPVDGLPVDLPCIMEPASTLYIAPEGNGVLLTLYRDDPHMKVEVDWDFVPQVASVASTRLPGVMEARVQTAWVGLVELTPDKLPVLCGVSEPEGFILANGLSGHGVMFSPAVGQVVSELVLDGTASTIDISELSLERF
jgi:sarcosine oxidase, subunit beta